MLVKLRTPNTKEPKLISLDLDKQKISDVNDLQKQLLSKWCGQHDPGALTASCDGPQVMPLHRDCLFSFSHAALEGSADNFKLNIAGSPCFFTKLDPKTKLRAIAFRQVGIQMQRLLP